MHTYDACITCLSVFKYCLYNLKGFWYCVAIVYVKGFYGKLTNLAKLNVNGNLGST